MGTSWSGGVEEKEDADGLGGGGATGGASARVVVLALRDLKKVIDSQRAMIRVEKPNLEELDWSI